MRSSRVLVGTVVVLTSVIAARSAAAIPITTDDFEDGTTMGWFVPDPGHPAPPANVATGGPAGAGDNYLQLTSTGTPGPGGRLAVLNESQWTGDYLTAGITSIVMSVNNFGPTDVTLRLLIEDFDAPGPPANLLTTQKNIVVPAGSGWVRVKFSLEPWNLTALIGTINDALSEVDTLRIFHNTIPDFPGPPIGVPRIEAIVGVDNIAVPEPATVLLLAGGLAAAFRRRL